MFGNTISFSKQLEITLKKNDEYIAEREKLKEMFYSEYDKITIFSLIELVIEKGHPAEKSFVEEFKQTYENDNFTDNEINVFNKLLKKYKPDLINTFDLTNGVKK